MLVTRRIQMKKQQRTTVALGCFDGMHIAHRKVVSAILEPDAYSVVVKILGKSGESFSTLEQDLCVLEEMGVQRVLLLELEKIRGMAPQEFVDRILCQGLKADKVACGFNFHFGHNGKGDAKLLYELCAVKGIAVRVVPQVSRDKEPVSTTRLKNLLAQGDVGKVAQLLGRPYSYDFEVVDGEKRGRLMGTPTINQHFPPSFVIPRRGVYASRVLVDGQYYAGVTNIGVKPTFKGSFCLSETWIPGYDGNLYGKRVPVSLMAYLRDEKKFDSAGELMEQIQRDGRKAKEFLSKHG